MTDKELLELAAKAAGYIPVGESEEGIFLVSQDGNKTYGIWDPLDKDAQAFRLAVKLEIYAVVAADLNVVSGRIRNGPRTSWREEINDDPYAATRRAIVRAAAEIGRTM